MAILIRETFRVQASAHVVWSYLTDPRRVVSCLPGAELVEIVDAVTFHGKVRIKVGPVTAAYAGQARFDELHAEERRVRIVAEAREAGGAGAARMTMTSSVLSLDDGATEVAVESRMDVAGKIVQFGRGMLESVSRQLFRQFTQCVRGALEMTIADAAIPGAALGDAMGAASPPAAGEAPAGTPDDPSADPASDAARQAAMPRPSKPIRVIPLASRAAWDAVSRRWRERGQGEEAPDGAAPRESGERAAPTPEPHASGQLLPPERDPGGEGEAPRAGPME
jgi:carbon monoxide dehydrogenase subunit G